MCGREKDNLTSRVAHPRFFDKLYAGSDFIGQIAEYIVAVTNTNCHTYAVAPVYSTMERAVIRAMAQVLGFKNVDSVDGCLNPGGTMSNLTAMIVSRHHSFPIAKQCGWIGDSKPVCFTGSQSHYSIALAAMIAGIGVNNCRKVQTNRQGCMVASDLEKQIKASICAGEQPFFVAATAGTTVMG